MMPLPHIDDAITVTMAMMASSQLVWRRSEECRHVPLGDEMEDEGAYSCEKESDRHVKTSKKRYENRCSEHGKHVLYTKDKHSGRAKLTGILQKNHCFFCVFFC